VKKYFNILLFIVLTLGLYFFYLSKTVSLPYSYYDEFWWINDSYLAQDYFSFNLGSPVWNSIEAKDQPMLTRLYMAAVLYPDYQKEKNSHTLYKRNDFTYSKYLISKGFVYSKTNLIRNYSFYSERKDSIVAVDINDVGSKTDFVDKYGPNILKTLETVDKIRFANAFLLAFSLIFLYFLIKSLKGTYFGLLYLLLTFQNKIIVESALKAHSEALFMLFFVLSLAFIAKWMNSRSLKDLLISSICIGLFVSVKINGVFMYAVLFILTVIKDHSTRNVSFIRILRVIVISGLITFSVVSILNPFILISPIGNFIEMYAYRYQTLLWQSLYFDQTSLINVTSRFAAIFRNIFMIGNIWFAFAFAGVFMIGLTREITVSLKRDPVSLVILFSFLTLFIAMLFYLLEDWPRYYIPMIFYAIYFEVSGIQTLLSGTLHHNSKLKI
jgi:hypothetical protein